VTTTVTETQGFWQWAAEHPAQPAVIEPDGPATSFAELASLVNRISHGLRAVGVHAGDRVAAILPNRTEYLALMLATSQIGVQLVPINWHLTAAEVVHIVTDSGAGTIIADARFADVARSAADDAQIGADRRFGLPGFGTFADLAELIGDQPETLPDDRQVGQNMVYTSGTSGVPKGVSKPLLPVPPEMLAGWAAGELIKRYGFTIGDGVHLTIAPIYHVAPGGLAMAMLHMGNTVVLADRFDAQDTLRMIDTHRVTNTTMVPTMFHRLLELSEEIRGRYDLSSLRQVTHGAAPCPVATKRRMIQWLGPIVHEYYGSSEGGIISVGAQEWLEHPGTVGRAQEQVRILDEAGDEVPEGVSGLVYIAASVLRFEYHNDTARTAAAYRGDFFTAGDIGHIRDGWLYLDDRRSDMINSAGVNIYPAEIEAVLIDHPAVADVAVIGVADADRGQRVVAVVQPATGIEPSPELAVELTEFARATLAGYKIPRTIEFRTELPRTPMGKLARYKLRESYSRQI
jgi:long-chain acyl-CoA synthetase